MLRVFKNIFFLCVIWIFTFKFFESTAAEQVFFQAHAVFLAVVLICLGFYVLALFSKKWEVQSAVVRFYLGLLIFVPIYSGMRASQEFGQPFFYGVLAERDWIIFGVCLCLHWAIVKNKLNFKSVEFSFLAMAWLSLIYFSLYILTFDTAKFYNPMTEVFFKVGESEARGLRFKFQSYFIVFGAIYYFAGFSLRRKWSDLVWLAAFLAYIFFAIKGRFLITCLMATFLVFYFRHFSSRKAIYGLVIVAFLAAVAFLALKVFYPHYFERMYFLFEQMFVVLAGEESLDPSANSRIVQSSIVSNYFEGNPRSFWLGTGAISRQWNDGYQAIFGHFYPSDIGLWGGIFVYGVAGALLICLIPSLISLKILANVSKIERTINLESRSVFIVALSYFLFFQLIRSVQGSYFFGIADYSVPLFLLMAYIKSKRIRMSERISQSLS